MSFIRLASKFRNLSVFSHATSNILRKSSKNGFIQLHYRQATTAISCLSSNNYRRENQYYYKYETSNFLKHLGLLSVFLYGGIKNADCDSNRNSSEIEQCN